MSLEPEQPHHGHHKTGLNWLDLAIALSAILISLTSLIITIVHSRALERMAEANAQLVQANSWPFIAIAEGDMSDGQVFIGLKNDGVGPAKIETLELRWRGHSYKDAVEFLTACCGFKYDPQRRYELATSAAQVMRAGEDVHIMTVEPEADKDVRDRFNAVRLEKSFNFNVCYCSVFDECWKADVARLTLFRGRVDRCDAPAVPFNAFAYAIPK